jgi:CRISPR-associated protein Csm3
MDIQKGTLTGKIILKGRITCRTGLHIGAADSGLAIGGIDSAVIRDPLTNQPYIPGSSLKGKLRSLLERSLGMEFNRKGGRDVMRHECNDPACPVCRLFGASTEGQRGRNLPARLKVRDAFLTSDSESELAEVESGLPYTEWKTENGLDRITAAANPRQLERVPAGAVFAFEMVYDVEAPEEAVQDLNHLASMIDLLEDDALGGGGSRGSGRVKIDLESGILRGMDYYLGTGEEHPLDMADETRLGNSAAAALGL